MKFCLDNTFVSDYLGGEDYTRDFLTNLPPDAEVYVPTVVRFEAFVPAFDRGGSRSLSKAKRALSGFKHVGFSEVQAEEAAEIRARLERAGERIGSPDVLIAGIAKDLDAEVVSSDDHFERVPGVDARDPRPAGAS